MSRRFAAGALAAMLGVALLAASPVRAEDALERAMEAAEGWNYAEALSWLRIAAERGDVRAQARLGMILIHGAGLYGDAVRRDPVEGREWLVRAAAQGSATARHALGRLDDAGTRTFAEAR